MPFVKLDTLAEKELVRGGKVRFVHTDTMTLAYWTFVPDSDFPEHSHPHEQVVNVIEGSFELTVGGETRRMEVGDVAVVPSNVPHSGRSLTACRLIDAFHPVREDYR